VWRKPESPTSELITVHIFPSFRCRPPPCSNAARSSRRRGVHKGVHMGVHTGVHNGQTVNSEAAIRL